MRKELSLLSAKKYKIYEINFFISCFSLLIIVSLINLVINPYGYFNSPVIPFLNQEKPEFEKNVMLAKAAEAKFIDAKFIVLGSSRVMNGLNIAHPQLGNANRVYNLGLPGTNLYQITKYFQYALEYQNNVEQVIFGIDFFMFNDNLKNLDTFDERRLENKFSLKDIIDNSLSINTFKASINTIIANINPRQNFIPQESTPQKFQRWLTNFLKFEGFYKTYNLSQARLEDFKSIIDICQENNIDLKVFISPTHATQYEAIAVSELWLTFEQWKREIVKITPVWDFATYNSITTEPISDNMVNYIDSSHYSTRTGNLVLNKILSYELEKVPDDFGVLITPDNIESHLDEINRNREKWRKNNSKEVQLVHHLQAKLNSK